ncbi:MAG: phospholipase A [Desulfosarcina sp.]
MKRRLGGLLLAIIIHTAPAAWSADLTMVLAPPPTDVRGGSMITLTLYLHNNTNATIVHELPADVPCRIVFGQRTVTLRAELVAHASAQRVEIPGRQFARRFYTLTLPIYTTGSVQITLDTIASNPLMLMVKKAPSSAWKGGQVPLDEGPTMLQSFLADLSVHEPMYFLFGVEPGLEQSTFQFSFKYRFFNPDGYLAKQADWLSGFYLGYTQRSLWDLKSDSKLFEDTSYAPELFYLLPKIDLNVDRISAFGLQGGIQHHSNGKGEGDSRSTNFLYLKPIMSLHLAGPYHLRIAPKIFAYVGNDDETNPDLADYLGYVDLETGIIDPQGLALNTHLWWAREGATVQLDLSYPLTQLLTKSFNFYLQAQYFSGYGNTLLNYDQRTDAFRLGVSIVR